MKCNLLECTLFLQIDTLNGLKHIKVLFSISSEHVQVFLRGHHPRVLSIFDKTSYNMEFQIQYVKLKAFFVVDTRETFTACNISFFRIHNMMECVGISF